MYPVHPDITEVVSSILVLAGSKLTEGIPREAIHSIFWEMQPEEPLLSRVRFSITGDVCFSHEIDTAINKLLVRGSLRTAKDGRILLNDIPTLRSLKHARHNHSKYYELLTASRNFYRRFNGWKKSVSSGMLEEGLTA